MIKIECEKSKKGFPVIWEAGGGFTNTGEATIVTNKDGQPKKPVYIRRKGQLANAEHALIPLGVGNYIIEANHHREDFIIKIYKVVDFKEEKYDEEKIYYAIVEQVSCFDRGEWDKEIPTYLEAAVQAAKEKATCYHCREPHFIKIDEE